ncbi:MAG TPA: ATP-binding protein [Desulfomonilaceae bacterium]|nr:ATP-binding protein [Desulfomonilaceae bacterium]
MLGLRQKLSLGFGGLFLIILTIGIRSIFLLYELGDSIDVILRENYRSVVACQDMKEAIESIDRLVQFRLLGDAAAGADHIKTHEARFDRALHIELNNITLPGEREKAYLLKDLFQNYREALRLALDSHISVDARHREYFTRLLPLYEKTKNTADEILRMNQQNMNDANDQARQRATEAIRQMYLLLIAGAVIAGAFIFLTRTWVLRPITRLIESAHDITAGNLDLVVKIDSSDEIGELSDAFNTMAESLRRVRRSRENKLAQMQNTVQQAFNELPDSVAVLDLNGRVEVATSSAAHFFGLKPDTEIRDVPLDWLATLYNQALKEGRSVASKGISSAIQFFVNGEERYFLPKVVPILDKEQFPSSVMIIISDVTQQRHEEDLKRGVISTVSHELKTPLTSVRMGVHLLLEQALGPLTQDQLDVLIAAEEDAERLHRILEDLLDIGRIESGKVPMDFHSVLPHVMCLDSAEPFQAAFKDKGINFVLELPSDLPPVWVDPIRINHVFSNLFSNALKHTAAGGTVKLSATADDDCVYFSVTDTGAGIPPEHLKRIFEQFFRLPDQDNQSGAGLGLAIAKEIVEAHSGIITAESEIAKGSTFTFSVRRSDFAEGEPA